MDNLIEYTPLLLRGAVTTLLLALASLGMATLLDGLGAVGKISGGRVMRAIVFAYPTIVRGVPDLVLILLIYYGGQRRINIAGKAMGVDYIELSKFWAGVAAIGFIYGAYLTETFRGAYEVVFMLHGSVVASIITIQDILGVGRTLNARYYLAYEGFLTAAALYMALAFVLVFAFRQLEKRYLGYLRVSR